VFVFLAALQVATSLPSLPSPSARSDPPPKNAHISPAKVITSFVPAGTIQILAETKTPATGFIPSDLETLGQVTSVPLLTDAIPKPTSLRDEVAAIPTHKAVVSISIKKMDRDIFADPISTNAPPANIGRKEDHPAPRLGITKNGPIETNKFYGNFHLGNQTSPTYLHPYSVAWPRGQGAPGTWGLAVSHVEPKQRVYGKTKPVTGAVSYFINPVGIHSVCLSAKELGPESTLTTDSLTDFSVQVNLHPKAGASPAVQFPLVQGSGFITAIYNGARPVLETGVFYRSVTRVTTDPKPGVTKYKLQLEDGTIWWLYARHTSGSALDLEVANNGYAQAKGAFHGTIQVAKDPGDGEKVYDQACGAYATGVKLVGSATDASGSYTFCFKKDGIKEATLVMFALPHHQSSFDGATKGKMANVKLQTTTKGLANAVLADSWTMVEPKLPTTIGFLPWSPEAGGISSISEAAKKTIRGIAQKEISQDIMGQTDQPSMYFSGKVSRSFHCERTCADCYRRWPNLPVSSWPPRRCWEIRGWPRLGWTS
jgi:endo-1,3(4)-beta-glucanase